jgi:purine nucleoside permease
MTSDPGVSVSRLDVSPKLVLLAAYENDSGEADEASRWLSHFDFDANVVIPGVDVPVYVDHGRGVLLAVTGIGNVEAAVTVAAIAAHVDCERTYFLTVGSAGTSPEVGTLGSVLVNDRILDWDQKLRWSQADGGVQASSIAPFPFKSATEVCKVCDPALVAAGVEFGSAVRLTDSEGLRRHRRRYPSQAAQSTPSVSVGASVSGSEFWHGRTCGSKAQQLAREYGVESYSTTEMEGFGTAAALERFGKLDRYLSIRGVSNFDRPSPGQDVGESARQNELALETCLENVYRVGSAIVSRILDDWEQWRDGVPARFETVRT